MDARTLLRKRFVATGQVQGVGFRPFIYRIAHEHALTGTVSNTSEGVVIEVQGTAPRISDFLTMFHAQLPPLAVLTHLSTQDVPVRHNEDDFRIVHSTGSGAHAVLISPDTALCDQCRADMQDSANRRFNYPFTNCTNCGPRYTITHSIPYDRATTSMACFDMCADCLAEYENPLDRRFHAQPNACPACGPRLWFMETQAAQDDIRTHHNDDTDAALHAAAKALHRGQVVAVKGLGGFHICCDAMQSASIARIREKKCRPHKALAVMVPDIATAHRVAHITHKEQALLLSAEKPIVLCARREGVLPHDIAPDTDTVGVMLAYTPLHIALFHVYSETCDNNTLPALVMTSGNAGGDPICLGNREAVRRLSPFVDAFLLHDRDILVRTDDSVCALHTHGQREHEREQEQKQQHEQHAKKQEHAHPVFYRRARGYVPRPVNIPVRHSVHGVQRRAPVVLGMGAQLKSTLCLTRQSDTDTQAAAFLSQHVGTLHNMETFSFYQEVLAHLEMLLQVRPNMIVHDLHPDFLSTHAAKELACERGIPCHALQHHFAHGYSVLSENTHTDKALVLALDGTGLGDDGTLWGGELLLIHMEAGVQRRIGRLSPFVMPGGEKAIHEPWRLAVALALSSPTPVDAVSNTLMDTLGVSDFALRAVTEMIERRVNCIETSSAGRLFDALSAALGICGHISYEGQAAIRLESVQNALAATTGDKHKLSSQMSSHMEFYNLFPKKVGALWELSSPVLFHASLVVAEQYDVAHAAQFFHKELARGFAAMTAHAAQEHNVRTVALTGGVMHNKTIHRHLTHMLHAHDLRVLTHKNVPVGDGGIALGQCAWGLWQNAEF